MSDRGGETDEENTEESLFLSSKCRSASKALTSHDSWLYLMIFTGMTRVHGTHSGAELREEGKLGVLDKEPHS